MGNINQIPGSIQEQQINYQISKDFGDLQTNITIYAYKIINLSLSELKNYTIQENSINIFRYEPLYFTKIKQDNKEIDCNWLQAIQTNEEINLSPIDSNDGNENVKIINIVKKNISIDNQKFFNSFSSQDFILFSINRPMEDCRIEDADWLFYINQISFLGNSVKKENAYLTIISINAFKVAKNSRIIFIKNENNFKQYKLNGLIITKPIETIIDTVQVIGYREGLAEEYQIPLSIEENIFTYVKFQVADETEVISLYFDWIDAYKILSFFYFINKIEAINPFTDIFNKEYNTNFWKAFLFTLCFSYIYNDGFSYLSNDYNTQKKITNYDDYFYVLLQNSKNNISSACDNWISNQIFSVPYTKNTNDWMKYKSIVLMCNEFLYSNICFNGGFNETQKLFLPFFFILNSQIDRQFLNNTLIFDASKSDQPKLDINTSNIELTLDSTFFDFVYDNDLKEYILKPYWTNISDKPLIGFIPANKREGWNEIKGKYLTIDNPLKKQNYLQNLVDLDKLNTEELKYLGILFFDKKEDLSRFWKYRNDNEIDTRIISFSNDFGEDKSKDIPFLINYSKTILENQGYSIKDINIFGTPSFTSKYTKYTINSWILMIRDLLLPAYKAEGIKLNVDSEAYGYLKDANFVKGDILNWFGNVYKVYKENDKEYADIIGIYSTYENPVPSQNVYTFFLEDIEDKFWNTKGSNFWKSAIKTDKGDKDNWMNPNNPYYWWIWANANIYIDFDKTHLGVGNINTVLIKKREIEKIKYQGKEYFFIDASQFWINKRAKEVPIDMLPAALFPQQNTNWNVKVEFNKKEGTISDFDVIYNRQNWLSYLFQLNPSYITGSKTQDFKILFKDNKNFKLTTIKTIRIRGIWGGDFGVKIRYIDDKGNEYIDDLKKTNVKDSFVLFDNNNERITETNINFV